MPYADKTRNRAVVDAYHRAHPDEVRANHKREREKLKAETIAAYGGACACCREDRLVFLTLDHVNGDGAEQRRLEGHRGGTQQYRRLRLAGFPPGFRVLCWNCNAAIHLLGECPHDDWTWD